MTDVSERLAHEIGVTVLDGIHSEPLEYVLRRGYAAMGVDPNTAARMCRKLAECQLEDQAEASPIQSPDAERRHALAKTIDRAMDELFRRGDMRALRGRAAAEEIADAVLSSTLAPVQSQPAEGWRPITTAPRDGSAILLWAEAWEATWGVQAGSFCGTDAGGIWITGEGSAIEGEEDEFGATAPTHWHPLPAPPTPDHPTPGKAP